MTLPNSSANSMVVPAFGGNPATIYKADRHVLRLLVRNVGGPTLSIAYDATMLMTPTLAGIYQLPPGQSDVFVLMPRQGLFAISAGNGGVVSVAISVAIPSTSMES